MIKLILTDIDNTILPRGNKVVSPATITAFEAAQAAGIHIGPASGRGLSWIPPFFDNHDACYKTAITSNGLQIYLDGELIQEDLIPRADVEALVDYVHAHKNASDARASLGVIYFTDAQPHLLCGCVERLAEVFPSYAASLDPHETPEAARANLPQELIKVNVFMDCDAAGTQAMVDKLNQVPELAGLDFDVALVSYSNVMVAGKNKGSALLTLCEKLQITPEDVVVFGDADNDLMLFDVTPNSICVSNGTPLAKEHARYHIGACVDDAVANAIQALARGEWPFGS